MLRKINNKIEKKILQILPHILSGASNSSKIGWLRNISLDLTHKLLISASVNWTFFPGLDPRTIAKIIITINQFFSFYINSIYFQLNINEISISQHLLRSLRKKQHFNEQ
jgi:hypothetical protein